MADGKEHALTLGPLEPILDEIRTGKVRPVYAFAGEGYFTDRAARALIAALVSEPAQSWNVERYDGENVDWSRALGSLKTPGFGPGYKIVWVSGTGVMSGRQRQHNLVDRVLREWTAGRRTEAAQKLADLLAASGHTLAGVESLTRAAPTPEAQTEIFGRPIDDSELQQLEAVFRFAATRAWPTPAVADPAEHLLGILPEGLAPRVVLLLTDADADQRARLWKKIARVGAALVFSVSRERNQALSRSSAMAIAREVTDRYGKVIDARAVDLLVQRAGVDVPQLANEVEKLCLWVGDRTRIGADDVLQATTDLAESWVFDLTSALSRRDLAASLHQLHDLLVQGEQPLRLVYLLARELRNLLLVREYVERELGLSNRSTMGDGGTERQSMTPPRGLHRQAESMRSVPSRGPTGKALEGNPAAARLSRELQDYKTFSTGLLPRISPEDLARFGKPHPFVLFKRFQDALSWTAEGLRAALIELGNLDHQLKTRHTEAEFLLDAFLFRWCRKNPS